MSDVSIIISTNANQVGKEIKGMAGDVIGAAAQAKALTNAMKFLDNAFNKGKISGDQYSTAIQKLDKSEDALYAAIGRVNKEIKQQNRELVATSSSAVKAATAVSRASVAAEILTKRQRMAGKSTNRFGMYAQQVGYQVGDFVVQVQSGANALVAFGQQGTQLAGLLPGIYGAILGIGLSVTTAVLQSTGALKGLTFDFKRFKEDTIKFLEPIMPVIRGIGTILSWLAQRAIDSLNLIINAFQYLVAAWKVVPDAIKAGVDWIAGQFTRMTLTIQSSVYTARAAWQGLKDTFSGTESVVSIVDLDSQGNVITKTISAVEDLTFKAESYSNQAKILGDVLSETGGSGKVIADAFRDVERIDLRNLLDYFGKTREVVEQTGNAVEEVEKKTDSLAQSIADTMGEGLMSMVDGTKSVKEAFRDMARDIIKQLYQVLVVQRLVGSAEKGTGIAGFLSKAFASANGNVFSGGSHVKAYANGGVVGGPTTFPMAGGKTGLMGEAGPEAIMPLKRGANGKLGVQMEGGGGDTIVVNQSFNFQANGDATIKQLIAQAAPKIAQMTKSSLLDDRRRGGSTKAAFG